MVTHKLLDSCFALSMKVLESVHSREIFHIQSIGGHNIWFPLEEVLSLNRGDLGHRSEDMGTVGCCPLHAVPVIDLPLACFLVYIELGRKGAKSVLRGPG